MRIKMRKAEQGDFEDYLKFKREEEKNLSDYLHEKIKYLPTSALKKEYEKSLKNKNEIIIFLEIDNIIISYLHGSFYENLYTSGGYIEDIFVLKKFRKKGYARLMINYFIKEIKKRKYSQITLEVNVKNKKAINFYKKIGLKLHHYGFKKRLK